MVFPLLVAEAATVRLRIGTCGGPDCRARRHPAGAPATTARNLFVDTRHGELHGCVTAFDEVEADSEGPRWRSLSAMLTDVAHSLETGEPFNFYLRPGIVDGRLEWRYAP